MVVGRSKRLRSAIRRWYFWFLAAMGCWVQLAAGSFKASLEQDSVEVGGTAVLNLSFTDLGEVEAPPAPVIPGATVSYLGASTQNSFQFSNGRQSQQSTVTHRYGITPKAEGILTIPPFTVTAGGQSFSNGGGKLTVGKAFDASAFAKLELVTPTNVLYVGQPFIANIRFLFSRNPAQVGAPQLPTDGFVVGRSVKPTGGQVRIGNDIWGVQDSPLVLFPARAGELTLGPAEMETLFAMGSRRGGFFGDFFAEQRRITLHSGSNTVTVLEPPTTGRPAGFQGAIGRFSLRVEARPTKVTVGDPITVRVQVDGMGGFDTLTLPEMAPESGFRSYAGTNGFQARDQYGFVGTKTFELVVVPERADLTVLQLPPLVSFDPEAKTYSVAEASPVPIVVRAGANAQAAPSVTPTYVAGPTNRVETLSGLGWQSARWEGAGPYHAKPVWPTQRWYWMALGGAPIAGAAVVVGYAVARRRQSDPARIHRGNIERRVASALQELESLEGMEAATAADQVLREQMSLVTGDSPFAINSETIDQKLVPRGLGSMEAQRMRSLFERVSAARFAPTSGRTPARELREQVRQAIDDLRHLEGVR